MYIFLSFVVALISLYYLGKMVDTYNADTTYITPLIILLIYSLVSIIRELREKGASWLSWDDGNDYYRYNSPYCGSTNNTSYNSANRWSGQYNQQAIKNETVETYAPDAKEKKTYEKELTHYTSKSEIREKIKELEKSRWFRIKRSIASFYGFDLNESYTRKLIKTNTINSGCKIVPIENKEDDKRFMPRLSWAAQREIEEYNSVVKHVGRSCELAFDKIIENSNNEQ